jgi:hypothetical protein
VKASQRSSRDTAKRSSMNAGPDAGLAKETVPGIIRTIHTPDDTIDKVDGKSVAQALRLATALVKALAE